MVVLIKIVVVFMCMAVNSICASEAPTSTSTSVRSCRKLNSCDRNIEFNLINTRGKKGDKGKIGPRGESGSNGIQGSTGEHGKPGSMGSRGPPGEIGDQGPRGDIGPIGVKGETGLTENVKCSKQERGEGKPKIIRTCKFKESAEGGKFYLSPAGFVTIDQFNVSCEGLKTCIKSNNEYDLPYNENKPFWISQKEKYLSYSIPDYELTALQSLSKEVTQTIEIECKNAYVYSNGENLNSSISFWTFNDIRLNPNSSDNNPLKYVFDNDGCKDSGVDKDVSKSFKVVLKETSPTRLPIKDIYIRDTRGELQNIRIKLGEICFT